MLYVHSLQTSMFPLRKGKHTVHLLKWYPLSNFLIHWNMYINSNNAKSTIIINPSQLGLFRHKFTCFLSLTFSQQNGAISVPDTVEDDEKDDEEDLESAVPTDKGPVKFGWIRGVLVSYAGSWWTPRALWKQALYITVTWQEEAMCVYNTAGSRGALETESGRCLHLLQLLVDDLCYWHEDNPKQFLCCLVLVLS